MGRVQSRSGPGSYVKSENRDTKENATRGLIIWADIVLTGDGYTYIFQLQLFFLRAGSTSINHKEVKGD